MALDERQPVPSVLPPAGVTRLGAGLSVRASRPLARSGAPEMERPGGRAFRSAFSSPGRPFFVTNGETLSLFPVRRAVSSPVSLSLSFEEIAFSAAGFNRFFSRSPSLNWRSSRAAD